jgi:hypothetical protein
MGMISILNTLSTQDKRGDAGLGWQVKMMVDGDWIRMGVNVVIFITGGDLFWRD